jgi:flagellar assembly protein FliH
MAISHLLEDFGRPAPDEGIPVLMSDEVLEDQRLTAFEQGYSAGWDDAIKAQNEDRTRLSAELLRSLEDVSFTYQEALSQLLAETEPVFRSLVSLILPDIMKQTIGHRIVEELQAMIKETVDQPLALTVGPGCAAAVKPLLEQQLPAPVDLIEDAAVGQMSARLHVGTKEREIDGEQLIRSIRKSLDAFAYHINEEVQNG